MAGLPGCINSKPGVDATVLHARTRRQPHFLQGLVPPLLQRLAARLASSCAGSAVGSMSRSWNGVRLSPSPPPPPPQKAALNLDRASCATSCRLPLPLCTRWVSVRAGQSKSRRQQERVCLAASLSLHEHQAQQQQSAQAALQCSSLHSKALPAAPVRSARACGAAWRPAWARCCCIMQHAAQQGSSVLASQTSLTC